MVLMTLKPKSGEIAMATLIANSRAEPELEDVRGEVEVPVIEITPDQSTPQSEEQSKMVQELEDLFKRKATEYKVALDPLDIRDAQDEVPPKTFSVAMRSINKDIWFHALVAEMRSLLDKGTFGLVSPLAILSGRKPLATKWVFDIKRDISGTITKFKARWVATGDLHKKGVDYRHTIVPVTSFSSLRIILTVAAQYDLEIGQLYILSASLNMLIDIIVYLRQPDGFTLGTRVCILHKSICGLCQAAKS